MKSVSLLSMLLMLVTLTSCEAIGNIFSAGMYTGFTIVLVVVVVIILVAVKMGKRG